MNWTTILILSIIQFNWHSLELVAVLLASGKPHKTSQCQKNAVKIDVCSLVFLVN